MEDKDIKISIISITYNQKDYIKDALDGMLMQKTSIPFEIIVHDDCSTDGTQDILRSYQAQYPDIVKPIFEEENQYSKGKDFFKTILFNHTHGEYVALCEGDDFWIDENKLQLQYEALESHPECDMCACWGCTVSEDGHREISQIRPKNQDGILSEAEVILGGGQYLVTAGLFFRRAMFDHLLEFEKNNSLDYVVQMKGALRGGIYYIDRKMAVYRRYAKGSWTNTVLHNDENLKVQWEQETTMLKQFDSDTAWRFHDAIQRRLLDYTPFDVQLEQNKEKIINITNQHRKNCYIWGMGRRGENLEKFFSNHNIEISGVCDAMNNRVGQKTECGNIIESTDKVLKKADAIFASTKWAFDDLVKSDFSGKIINFQQFMPYG